MNKMTLRQWFATQNESYAAQIMEEIKKPYDLSDPDDLADFEYLLDLSPREEDGLIWDEKCQLSSFVYCLLPDEFRAGCLCDHSGREDMTGKYVLVSNGAGQPGWPTTKEKFLLEKAS